MGLHEFEVFLAHLAAQDTCLAHIQGPGASPVTAVWEAGRTGTVPMESAHSVLDGRNDGVQTLSPVPWSWQVQQHLSRLHPHLERRRAEDPVLRVYTYCAGCHSLRGTQLLYLRVTQEPAPR